MGIQGHTASAKKLWIEICFVNPLVSRASVYVCVSGFWSYLLPFAAYDKIDLSCFLLLLFFNLPSFSPFCLLSLLLFNFITGFGGCLTESLRMLFSPQNSRLPFAWSFNSHLFQEDFFAPILGSTKRHSLICPSLWTDRRISQHKVLCIISYFCTHLFHELVRCLRQMSPPNTRF